MDRQSYYYQQMNENEQLAYRIICDGLHCHQSAIRVLLYPGMKSVSDIYYKVPVSYTHLTLPTIA